MKRISLIAVFCISTIAVDLHAQTIADLARQERARKQNLESKAVFNADTVKLPTPEAVAVPVAPPTTAEPAAALPTGPTDRTGRDEKTWRAMFDTARTELARTEGRVQVLEAELGQLQRDLLSRADIYNREGQIGQAIAQKNAELEAARTELEQRRQRITDLEDELRRSGGLPGWAR